MDEIVRGRYRHFKGGVYIVIGTATHSETGEDLVIYHKDGSGLVVTDEEKRLWARPTKMWNETVFRHGSEKPRFELLNTIPAADVVEVVRCGECRYRYNTYSGWFCSRGVFVNDAVPPDDWYCADGKCKDGGQDDV